MRLCALTLRAALCRTHHSKLGTASIPRTCFNPSPSSAKEYDGLTTLLTTAELPVTRGQQLHVQLIIAGEWSWANSRTREHQQQPMEGRGSNPYCLHSSSAISTHAPGPHACFTDRADSKQDSAAFIRSGSLTVTPTQINITTTATKARERRWLW